MARGKSVMSTVNPQVAKKTKFRKGKTKGNARKKGTKKTKANGSKYSKSISINSNTRPCIKMYAGEHSTIADQVEHLLIQDDVQFFQRSGELVRPISVKLPAAHGAKTTAIHLREGNPGFARDMMSRNLDFVRYDERAGEWKPTVARLPMAARMIERT